VSLEVEEGDDVAEEVVNGGVGNALKLDGEGGSLRVHDFEFLERLFFPSSDFFLSLVEESFFDPFLETDDASIEGVIAIVDFYAWAGDTNETIEGVVGVVVARFCSVNEIAIEVIETAEDLVEGVMREGFLIDGDSIAERVIAVGMSGFGLEVVVVVIGESGGAVAPEGEEVAGGVEAVKGLGEGGACDGDPAVEGVIGIVDFAVVSGETGGEDLSAEGMGQMVVAVAAIGEETGHFLEIDGVIAIFDGGAVGEVDAADSSEGVIGVGKGEAIAEGLLDKLSEGIVAAFGGEGIAEVDGAGDAIQAVIVIEIGNGAVGGGEGLEAAEGVVGEGQILAVGFEGGGFASTGVVKGAGDLLFGGANGFEDGDRLRGFGIEEMRFQAAEGLPFLNDGFRKAAAVATEIVKEGLMGEGEAEGVASFCRGKAVGRVIGVDGLVAERIGGEGAEHALALRIAVVVIIGDVGGVAEGIGDFYGVAVGVVFRPLLPLSYLREGAVPIGIIGVAGEVEELSLGGLDPFFEGAIEEVVKGEGGAVFVGLFSKPFAEFRGATEGVIELLLPTSFLQGPFEATSGVVGVLSDVPLGIGGGEEVKGVVMVAGLFEEGAIGGVDRFFEEATQGIAGIDDVSASFFSLLEELPVEPVDEGFLGMIGVENPEGLSPDVIVDEGVMAKGIRGAEGVAKKVIGIGGEG